MAWNDLRQIKMIDWLIDFFIATFRMCSITSRTSSRLEQEL